MASIKKSFHFVCKWAPSRENAGGDVLQFHYAKVGAEKMEAADRPTAS